MTAELLLHPWLPNSPHAAAARDAGTTFNYALAAAATFDAARALPNRPWGDPPDSDVSAWDAAREQQTAICVRPAFWLGWLSAGRGLVTLVGKTGPRFMVHGTPALLDCCRECILAEDEHEDVLGVDRFTVDERFKTDQRKCKSPARGAYVIFVGKIAWRVTRALFRDADMIEDCASPAMHDKLRMVKGWQPKGWALTKDETRVVLRERIGGAMTAEEIGTALKERLDPNLAKHSEFQKNILP